MPEDKHKDGKRKAPPAPQGEGPVLEWFHPTTGRAGWFSGIALVIFAGYLTLRDGGLGWMSVWWLWLIFLPFPLLFLLTNRNVRMSAGADWLRYGGKAFVKTYELARVEVTVDGFAHSLTLEDTQGRTLGAQLNNLQLNRELWDLVYNGILHSVHAGGAETNKLARDYLGLNVPPHLRQ